VVGSLEEAEALEAQLLVMVVREEAGEPRLVLAPQTEALIPAEEVPGTSAMPAGALVVLVLLFSVINFKIR
jgi:hypothetical protein